MLWLARFACCSLFFSEVADDCGDNEDNDNENDDSIELNLSPTC